MRFCVGLILMILVSGCKVGPNYHRPCLDVPDSFHYDIENAKDTLNLEWWTQFNDKVLEDLIAEALANNKDVKIAAANIENAVGILIQTRAALFPQIGYSDTYSRTRSSLALAPTGLPVGAIPNPITAWQAAITGSWDIDVWGHTRRLVESAQANVFATYEARQNVILALVAAVANSYVQLRALDEQLAISIRTMNAYGEEVTYFETQFNYGQASQMAVAQAKTQYEYAAAQVPQIKTQITVTENAINILLGQNPGPIPRGKTIDELTLPDVPADIPSNLLAQRPDIIQAEEELIAANAQIGAAEALYFPAINLTGYYGTASARLSTLFTGPAHTWNFTGAITGPIFTAGAIYGQVLQAESLQQAALYNYEKVIQKAFADVEDALIAHTNLAVQLEAERRLVEAAGEYQRLAMLQFKGGYAPYFMVIQAEQQYFPAQLAWTETRAQLFTSLVNIYQAMGGGWVVLAEKQTGYHPCD